MKNAATPTFSEIQRQVPYPLRKDLTQRDKPYTCTSCGQHHRYVGSTNDLVDQRLRIVHAVFCPVCVANGKAIDKIHRITRL